MSKWALIWSALVAGGPAFAAFVASLALLTSEAVRNVLRSIFRRPRETSVLVAIDGKHVELSGSQASPEAIQRLVEQMGAAADPDEPPGRSENATGGQA